MSFSIWAKLTLPTCFQVPIYDPLEQPSGRRKNTQLTGSNTVKKKYGFARAHMRLILLYYQRIHCSPYPPAPALSSSGRLDNDFFFGPKEKLPWRFCGLLVSFNIRRTGGCRSKTLLFQTWMMKYGGHDEYLHLSMNDPPVVAGMSYLSLTPIFQVKTVSVRQMTTPSGLFCIVPRLCDYFCVLDLVFLDFLMRELG